MRKLILIAFSFVFSFKILFASTYSTDPSLFIKELVNDAIEKLSDINLDDEQKNSFIREVASEHVDINALGLYTLGELRKTTDENNIQKYQ